jgi:tetratricopeptide (TPR) repeat protein
MRLLIAAFACSLVLSSGAEAAAGHVPGPVLLALNGSDLDREIAKYTEQIRRDPEGTMAYNQRAYLYMNRGYLDRALADFTKLIELSPNYGQYYRMRAEAYGMAGDYDKAIADYDSWLAFSPNDLTGHHNRGLTYRLKGDYRRAISDFTFNVQRYPDYVTEFRERGATRIMADEFSSAIADFGQVLHVKPQDWEAILLSHLAAVRSGAGGASLSPSIMSEYERGKWPWPILAFLTGGATAADVRAAAAAGSESDRRDQLCSTAFWLGENEIATAKPDAAKPLLEEAVRKCPRLYFEYSLAKFELARLQSSH